MKTTGRLITVGALTAALGVGAAPAFGAPASSAAPSPQAHGSTASTSAASDGSAAASAFQDKWEGKYIDVDGYYGAQCWDLAARYSLDIGLPAVATGDGAAAGIYENFNTNGNASHYNRHPQSTTDPNSVPRPGDIIVWNRNMGGGYGHVAVVLKANWDTVTVLEQNPGAAHVTTYKNYANVLGWLRPKKFA